VEVHCGFDLKNIRAEKHMFVVGEFIRRSLKVGTAFGMYRVISWDRLKPVPTFNAQ
jgi:hypothetical protein